MHVRTKYETIQSACYVVSDVAASGHSVVTCNARMSELFMYALVDRSLVGHMPVLVQ